MVIERLYQGTSDICAASYIADISGKSQSYFYLAPETIHVTCDLSVVEEPELFDGCGVIDLDAEDWLEVSYFERAIAAYDIFAAYFKPLEQFTLAVISMLSNVQFTG